MGKRPDTQQPNGHSDSSEDRRQNEDPDATVIDVFNTNQALFPGERISEDESSGFSNTDDGEERMLKCYGQYPENVKTPIRGTPEGRPRGQIQVAKQEERSQLIMNAKP